MSMSYDDQFLFSVGMDGSLFAFRVVDKEGRGLKREKDITFSEEVLVTKSDLEEKVSNFVNVLVFLYFVANQPIVYLTFQLNIQV